MSDRYAFAEVRYSGELYVAVQRVRRGTPQYGADDRGDRRDADFFGIGVLSDTYNFGLYRRTFHRSVRTARTRTADAVRKKGA